MGENGGQRGAEFVRVVGGAGGHVEERELAGLKHSVDKHIPFLAVFGVVRTVVEFDAGQRLQVARPDQQEVDVLLVDTIARTGAAGGIEAFARREHIAEPHLDQIPDVLGQQRLKHAEKRALGGGENRGLQGVVVGITGAGVRSSRPDFLFEDDRRDGGDHQHDDEEDQEVWHKLEVTRRARAVRRTRAIKGCKVFAEDLAFGRGKRGEGGDNFAERVRNGWRCGACARRGG